MKSRHRKSFALALAIVLLGSLRASADPIITVNLIGENPNNVVVNFKFNGAGEGAYAGLFAVNFTVNGVTSGPFDAYCIDVYHDLGIPSTWQAHAGNTFGGNAGLPGGDPNGSGNFQEIAQLFNQFNGFSSVAGSPNAAGSPTYNAALQVAIWAAEYDGKITNVYNNNSNTGFSYGSSATSTDAVFQQANWFLTHVNPNDNTPGTFLTTIQGTATNGAQDLITGGQNNPVTNLATVPEPSSVALMVSGLGVVALRIWKARRTRRDA